MKKIGIWASIIGAGLVASLGTAATFFKDYTLIITAGGTLISAIVAFIVTHSKTEVEVK